MLNLFVDDIIFDYISLYYLIWNEKNHPDNQLLGIVKKYEEIKKINSEEDYINNAMNFFGNLNSLGMMIAHIPKEDIKSDLIHMYETLKKIHINTENQKLKNKSPGWNLYKSKQHEKALLAFLQSAESGDTQVFAIIGAMYHDGEGVKVDKNQSHMWWCKAALLGRLDAIKGIARFKDNKDPLSSIYTFFGSELYGSNIFCPQKASDYLLIINNQ